MALYTLSDTHLSFQTAKPMDIFGSRWQNHADKIANNWNTLITPEDTVVIPGDITWAMTLDEATEDFRFLSSLPGKKIIGKGNHDYWWQTRKKVEDFFAQNQFNNIILLYGDAYRVEDKIICGTRGWYNDGISPRNCDYQKIVLREAGRLKRSLEAGKALGEGELIAFLHFPPVFGDFICREHLDILHSFEVKRVYYGHIHGVYNIPPRFAFEGIHFTLVSADYLNFVPLRVF
ncbi:MAG: serine/threonine protein phosphatase [Ruminococcaceae bacterium]|nr:serine/threonine protein phosphatase [Oscillospiraceae bacterium]